MTDVVIRAEGLGKQYTIGERRDASTSLRDAIAGRFQRNDAADGRHAFWALRDVSFEVFQGEVLGIVGRNGAGKSTLLKIISRITEPTTGWAEIHGRVGSLLDVGTGFHPELTGRENIFLNGAILGMTRREIQTRFDEIVSFAGVELFLDTPVKRYSSGMYVRLAFAVAAHLETEILIVDEVLAVGDVEFQQKCIAKMRDVAGSGRTVLFVSHNIDSVQQMTTRCLRLDAGQLVASGPTSEVVRTYLDSAMQAAPATLDANTLPRRNPEHGTRARITALNLPGLPEHVLHPEASLPVQVTLQAAETLDRLQIRVTIYWLGGREAGTALSSPLPPLAAGDDATFNLQLADLQLAPGRYQCVVAILRGGGPGGVAELDVVRDVLPFDVAHALGDNDPAPPWRMDWGPVRFSTPEVTRIDEQQ